MQVELHHAEPQPVHHQEKPDNFRSSEREVRKTEVLRLDYLEQVPTKSPDSQKPSLPKDQGRFIVYNYQFKLEDDIPCSKLILFVWAPIGAKALQKMKYSSTVGSFSGQIAGLALTLQPDSDSDLTEAAVKQKLKDKLKLKIAS